MANGINSTGVTKVVKNLIRKYVPVKFHNFVWSYSKRYRLWWLLGL